VRNNGRWTEARYRSFIVSALRSASRRWPPKYETLKEALIDRRINPKSGKLAAHYRCAACSGAFTAKGVQVDHINPVVDPATGFVSWDVYINRMYCEGINLQVLCSACHAVKTKEEKDATKRVSEVSREVCVPVRKPRVPKRTVVDGGRKTSRANAKGNLA
jgi:hypothetical protein